MRALLGTTATILQRRGIALQRTAQVTLARDAFAATPGPSLTLSLGERTAYRPAAWSLDQFERAALGGGYTALTGYDPLQLVAFQAVPTAVGVPAISLHTVQTPPRDQWAAATIAALSGAGAVGVVVRAAQDPVRGYRVTAEGGNTVVIARAGATVTTLATIPTPWRVGDVLRVEVAWQTLRIYRDAILIGTVTLTDALDGFVGIAATRPTASDTAALGGWAGGPLRQEYLGAVLDMGDIQRVLGQPLTAELTLSNVAPMGGADRFAALLRHGLNTAGYDLDRGRVRVSIDVGGTAPLLSATGVIDAPGELTEDRVRLQIKGPDAFLTPRIVPGVVTYLPGPLPGGLTPLPVDPCATATEPVIVLGTPPAAPAEETPIEGVGPDDPGAGAGGGGGGGGGGGPLLGTWWIKTNYTLVEESLGVQVYVGSTAATPIPADEAAADAGITPQDEWHFITLRARRHGAILGTEAFPAHILEWFIYRGPDVGGTELHSCQRGPCTTVPDPKALTLVGWDKRTDGTWTNGLGITLARYEATAIHTPADLTALRYQHPGELVDPFPDRIEACAAWTVSCSNLTPRVTVALAPVPTNQFTGPQLLRLEFDPGWSAGHEAECATEIATRRTVPPNETLGGASLA